MARGNDRLGLAVALAVHAACGDDGGSQGFKGQIQVRGLFDRSVTLITSDPINAGVLNFIADTNANGGIAGYEVVLVEADTQYSGALAAQRYDEFKAADDLDADGRWDTVATLFGEGTPDTLGVASRTNTDEMPYFSQAYPGVVASPNAITKMVGLPDGSKVAVNSPGYPYNFFIGTDYSTSIRIAMQFIAGMSGSSVVFLGCSNPYCLGPLPAGKSYAAMLGLGVAPAPQPCDATDPGDMCPELADTEQAIATKVQRYFTANPSVTADWVWIGNLTDTTTYIVKAVHALKPDAKFMVNVFGFDESLFGRCGDACVGRVYGLMPVAAFGDTTVPGMSEVVRIFNGHGDNDPAWANVRYVQGYVTAFTWSKAVEQLIRDQREVTGPNVKLALQQFTNLSTGGLSAPISYTADDHRPNSQARIYSIGSTGKLVFEQEVRIPLQADWLGW